MYKQVMFRYLIIVISLAGMVSSCSNKKPEVIIEHVPRDTTITSENAYTNLLLDSLSVEEFIKNEVGAEGRAIRVRNFYNGRNYQFAWFDEKGLTEQGSAFWNLHQASVDKLNDSSIYSVQLHERMEAMTDESTSFTNNDLQLIELRLTQHFFTYLNTAFKGKVSPEEMQWHIPRRKIDEEAMLDSFLTRGKKEWKPLNEPFYKLQNKILQYASVAKNGGWPVIEMKKKSLKTGTADPAIAQVKHRLYLTGDLSIADTSDLFNESLLETVKRMQRSFGLKESGIIDAALVKELNVVAEERVKQMKVNLERMRWMPEESKSRLVANIPEYKLYVYENGAEVFDMDIVVGKAANKTVIFSDLLQHVVFSPYWNIPRSIVKNEIVPAMNRSSSYLSRNNMEITGNSNGLPIVRQKPGSSNALGKVKFIFPNRYNIYFHDTPAKTLFNEQRRAFSHGCIRLHEPFKLAAYLLQGKEEWTDKKITAAMNRGKEQWVKIDEPVPVFIVYFTSWVGSDGIVNFRDDVYGHDKRMYDHLFEE